MRTLVLLRGAPGAGKSTWVKQNELDAYTLSPDTIRTMLANPTLNAEGKFGISQSNDRLAWSILFQMLEQRMQRGDFTVIDATCSKREEMNHYKTLAQTYRYRVFLVDFTDISIDECKKRNSQREESKVVPEEAIERMYSRFETQKVPNSFTVIKPTESEKIWYKISDFSKWKKIHHIGDIHGCFSVIEEYLNHKDLNEDELYIFCGDYIDRGIENRQVIDFLLSIYEKPNVILLEGNHERWLNNWAHDEFAKSKQFEVATKKELEGLDKRKVRQLYRKLWQCVYYSYGDKKVLVTHGGLSCIPDNLTLVSTEQMIFGAGRYSETRKAEESFYKCTDKNTFQIHGHRNIENFRIEQNVRSFNLEGKVEFGEDLRVVTLDANGFETRYITNNVIAPDQNIIKDEHNTCNIQCEKSSSGVPDLITKLRGSKYITEKKYGNISSFNFTRDAFYKKEWNDMTIKARGLFIDTQNGKIAARAYEKFFNLNERKETSIDYLSSFLKFPLTAYVKENGFLGIVSYNYNTDDFFITSKTDPNGIYSMWFKEIFKSTIGSRSDELKTYLKEHDLSLIFECIDIENDPHIIEYDYSHIVLLDAVKNQIKFEKIPFEELVEIGNRFNIKVKQKAYTINTWQDFCLWLEDVVSETFLFSGKPIEGFVVEDANGYMFKVKSHYYLMWKKLRSVAGETIKFGCIHGSGQLYTPTMNYFYSWVKDRWLEFKNGNYRTDIISLRNMFYFDNETKKRCIK